MKRKLFSIKGVALLNYQYESYEEFRSMRAKIKLIVGFVLLEIIDIFSFPITPLVAFIAD